MIRNCLIAAFNNFLRKKKHTVVNQMGLSLDPVDFACAISVSRWVFGSLFTTTVLISFGTIATPFFQNGSGQPLKFLIYK